MILELFGVRAAIRALGLCAALLLAACDEVPLPTGSEELIGGVRASEIVPGYGPLTDAGIGLPPVPPEYLRGVNRRVAVNYNGAQPAGTIEIDPYAKFLYWVQPGSTAIRYPIAVGREGLGMEGTFTVGRKAQWPGWIPTANMIAREPEVYGPYRDGVPGGLTSPLGARALYLYRGRQDTYFRVHGTNDLSSIGNSGSAGCIRLFNHDIIDLYNRVPNGTAIIVRTYAESVRLEGQAMASRGIELPPFFTGEGQRPPVPEAMLPESQYRGNMAFLEAPLMGDFAEVMTMEMVGTGFAPRG